MNSSPSAARTRRRRTSVAGEDQSWTATKCLRLLRPIHVRIGNLRQLSTEAVKTAPVAKKPTFLTSGGKKRSSSDDEWDPSGTKRAKVTYAQRKRKAKRHSDPGQSSDLRAPNSSKTACWAPPPGPTTPGKFLITTPLIKRIKNAQFSPCPPSAEPPAPCHQETGLGAATTRPGLSYLHQDIQSLKSSRAAAAQVRHEEALLQALDALFRHAAGRGVSGGAASKSLVAMCLRQAPHQLRRIEEWEADEAERRGDRTTLTASEAMPEMYQQMESLGHGDAGWGPLRHMVRAHAISSICEAIAEGIVDFSFTKLLVKVCAHWQCLDEALMLFESLLLQQYPRSGCQEDVPTPTRRLVEPLAYFITFCSQHGRWSSLFSTLERLLSEDCISGEWLCTNTFEPVWTALSRRLVNAGRACPWTLKFFHTAILSLARFTRDIPAPGSSRCTASTRAGKAQRQAGSPRQMFVSTVGAVTAMALMSLGRGGPSSDGIYRSVLYALDGSLSELAGWPSSRMLHYQSLLEVGICAVSSAGSGGHSPTRLPAAGARTSYARGAQVNRRLYEGAVSLICSIAQHCSRGSPLAPHQHLLTICDSMAHVSLMGRSISDVKKDGAFMLAKRTCDLRDLAFAESKLPAEDRRGGSVSAGERRSEGSASPGGFNGSADVTTVYSGWSWDEGISEWVIRTPAPAAAAAAPAAPAPGPARRPTAPKFQKPCREVIALKTRFGRLSGKASEASKRQARAARPSTPPPRTRRPATRRVLSAESDDDCTSEDEMAGGEPAVRSTGQTAAAAARLRADEPRARTRRKMVRKISSWHGLGSSDDELLL